MRKKQVFYKTKCIFFILLPLLTILLTTSAAVASSVTMAWDPINPIPQGYKVFQRIGGTAYDYDYPAWPIDGSDHLQPTCTITNLTAGVTYFFIVRAYVGSNQSSDSNEISYTVPAEVTLSSIIINGLTQFNENSSSQYTCTAHYSDGSTAALSSGVTWSENDLATSISVSGLLTATNVTADTAVTITASYGGRSDTYRVTVKDGATSVLDSRFVETTITEGVEYYTDRSYQLTSVPAWYEDMEAIITPNDDRNRTDASGYMTFAMPYDGTVYVAYDSRATQVPHWMNDFTDTGDVLKTSLSSQPSLKIYSRNYAIGAIVNFGANKATGFSGGIVSNYLVFYSSCSGFVDSDGDGWLDSCDNCIEVANADQRDADADGYGNRCDTDLNNDLITNWLDVGRLRMQFLTPGPDADFNGDGVVNGLDMGILRLYFLKAPGPSGLVP